MSNYVRDGDRIIPRSLLIGSDPKCICGGTGIVAVDLGNSRLPATAPCQSCRVYCPVCRAWRRKSGHICTPLAAKDGGKHGTVA